MKTGQMDLGRDDYLGETISIIPNDFSDLLDPQNPHKYFETILTRAIIRNIIEKTEPTHKD